MDRTKIDWCDSAWNPVTGCLHGCKYCYSREIAKRFSGGGEKWTDEKLFVLNERFYGDREADKACPYPYGFMPTFHRYRLEEYQSKKGRNMFVCSMADLFGSWVPSEWIEEVFAACRRAPQHNYLFLTKNFLRASKFKFEKNWWIGRTHTSDKDTPFCEGDPWSTDKTKRANQFLSIEPLLGEVTDLPYYAHSYGFRWVIVGAETGRRKDKVTPKREWIERIVNDCEFRNIPVFMKSSLADIWGEDLIQEYPEELKPAN